MREDFAYPMAHLSSHAYDMPEVVNRLFKDGITLGGMTWTFDPAWYFEDTGTHTQCYIFVSPSKADIALAFRGSEVYNPIDILKNLAGINVVSASQLIDAFKRFATQPADTIATRVQDAFRHFAWVKDWLVDFSSVIPTDWPSDVPGAKVAASFLSAWQSVADHVKPTLRTLIKEAPNTSDVRLFVTGHSLGGALSTLAAVDIWKSVIPTSITPQQLRYYVYTFATPVVGNAAFAAYYNSLYPKFNGGSEVWRDPGDIIQLSNELLTAQIKLPIDPYVDVDLGYSTNSGKGHSITNYLELLNPSPPGSAQGTSRSRLTRRQCNEDPAATTLFALSAGPPIPAPTDQVSTLIVRTVTSNSYEPDLKLPPPPCKIALVVGATADGSGGVELVLDTSSQLVPFLLPGQTDTFSVVLPANSLTISDFQRCQLKMSSKCSENPCYPDTFLDLSNPLLLDGLEIVVNGFPLFADYSLGASLSIWNSTFRFVIPTPHYSIVGGRMRVTNDTSKEPWTDYIVWGTRTDQEVLIADGRCWTEQYQENSYYYTSVYIQRAAGGPFEGREVVGGRLQVSDSSSHAPWIETSFWGERTANEVVAWKNYGYSEQYGPASYFHTSFYLRPANAAPSAGPRVIGGRMQVSNDSSQAPWITTRTWGETSNYETYVGQGWCYSTQYGGSSYQHLSVYTDRPVVTQSNNPDKKILSVNIVSITCQLAQERGMLGNHDEIMMKLGGEKIWPTNADYVSISSTQSIPVNYQFTVSWDAPAHWELWEVDPLFDDQLYDMMFSLQTLVYEVDTGTWYQLQECAPGRQYRAFLGPTTENVSYAYYLTISVGVSLRS